MSLIDRLMYSAIEKGQDSIDVGRVSYKYGGSFWGCMLTGAIVFYFFGWEWSILPFGLGIYRFIVSLILTSVSIRLEVYEKRKNDRLNEH